jgi:arabinofuranosyltransferase
VAATPSPRGPLWVLAAAVVLAVAGWRLFWFLTDDAYITFRYVSNLHAGYGLVWNPPPFRPVEGYTSFLWALLLAASWRVTGIEPPRAACVLSLCCGVATLVLVWRMLGRLRLSPRLERSRGLLCALALLGICTNRTFLTWLSSGLETQLFNLCFTWWLGEAAGLLGRGGSPGWGFRLSAAAALSALARPDGLLAVPATLLLCLLGGGKERQPPGRALLSAGPLLAVAAHLLWRRATYGEWLPNTYYAKVVTPWPESGWRFLASFVVENGVWVWLALVLIALAATIRRGRRGRRGGTRLPLAAPALPVGSPVSSPVGSPVASRQAWRPARAIAPAVVLAHVGYYVLIVGGDHFEYRVFSYLIPLLFVSAVALADACGFGRGASVAWLTAFLLASYPLGWLHWWRTKDRLTRDGTFCLRQPLAPDFPPPLRQVVAVWDAWQFSLISHFVCVRQQEHKVFHDWTISRLPSRQEGSEISWDERPVIMESTVGIVGWILPHVAVIDMLGLNDRVIAHTPPPVRRRGKRRLMAHERRPPPGYVECFLPNVELGGGTLRLIPRPVPLTDERIRACESRDWRTDAGPPA